ncbi:hypothetical protein ACFPRA_01310 [Sporosarcina soli]|uniref:Uncharacterized protein n=1 Tax=Sporosarcina soli TaxID=334736 RepID=A0ABW0TDP7_9BACL
MKWFDKSSFVQMLPQDITETFIENGWKNFLKYRYRYGNTTEAGQKYADVRLFRSTGSDRVKRNLGMVFGYDTAKSSFADNRIISDNSPLGILGVGDGTIRDFQVKVYPIDKYEDVDVYVDGTRVNDSRYEVIDRDGIIRFKSAPSDGSFITITYKMASTAPEPPTFLVFFTFDSVHLSRLVGDDEPINIADGDGETTEFYTPTRPIKLDSMYLYINGILLENEDYKLDLTTGKITFNEAPALGAEITARYITIIEGATLGKVGDGDGVNKEFWTENAPIATDSVRVFVNGILQDKGGYEVDHEEGKVTFNVAPVLGAEVTISYIDLTGSAPSGVTQLDGDIRALKSFNPNDPRSLMDAVYSSLDYKIPSLPTVLDFTSESEFGRGWQRDSFVYNWGNINKDRCMMFIRPDPTTDAESALFAPLYFGRLHGKGITPRRNMIIAAGSSSLREIRYQPNAELGGQIVDFGKNTSNGNQGVQLMQGVGGAYYQQHYLKFHTASQNIDNGEGKFQPSVYSGKYHVSQFKITHPNDGDVGYLDDVLAIHAKGIHQSNEMEVERDVYNEVLGFGDGINRVFHVRHAPFGNEFQSVQVDCMEVTNLEYEYDPDTKTIKFNVAPEQGEEVIVGYSYSHLYQFNKPTTPISAFTLAKFTPHTEIGIGVLKDPQKPRKVVS